MHEVHFTQLSIDENEKVKPVSVVFTGHRVLQDGFSVRRLKNAVKKQIENGVTTFYNGMAMGFDLLAAEQVLQLKKVYPHIRLVACIPCYGQEKYFSETDKKRYADVLKSADETIVLSPTYYRGCMQQRNRYMVERADVMIAYCNEKKGGAAYTVKCFQKTKPFAEIIFI